MPNLVPIDTIINKIVMFRGEKVIIDRDLAELYGVTTKALNQAVKRNKSRFPSDFMFKLTQKEKLELVTNCDRFASLKHSSVAPGAFTEQGVAMLSSVLNSKRAVEVNIAIMRAFVHLRKALSTHKKLAQKLLELERHFEQHDEQIQAIFEAIKLLISEPENRGKKIGFTAKEKQAKYAKGAKKN